MSFKTYDELVKLLDANGGVLTCEMRYLREAHGAGKLGVNVVANISEALDHRGLSHYPDPLPIYQHESARIYKRNSQVGELIKATMTIDEKNDEILRSISNDSASEVVKKIRELVCD